jgi:outer membrane protein assembly factor BamB
MNDHERNQAPFQPEMVDEQIDNLARSHAQTTDEQLISDLHTLHEMYTASHERVWQRLQERLASTTTPSPNEQQKKSQIKPSPERDDTMRYQLPASRHIPSPSLNALAAVVFTALLIGAWFLTMAHQHPAGSKVNIPGTATLPKTTVPQNPHRYSGVYVDFGSGLMHVDLHTGKVIWRYDLPDAPTPSDNPASVERFVYAGGIIYAVIYHNTGQSQTSLIALDADNGTQLWSQPLATENLSTNSIAVAGDTIYLGVNVISGSNATNAIYSFSTANGQRGVTYKVSSYIFDITLSNETLYVATQDGLYAFDLKSHQQRWHTTLVDTTPGMSLTVTRPVINNEILYTTVTSGNETGGSTTTVLMALNAQNGKQLWQSDPFEGQAYASTIAYGVVYFGTIITQADSFTGTLYAYNAHSGKQLWQQTTNGGIEVAPSVSNGIVYASTFRNQKQPEYIIAIHASNGSQVWQHQLVAGLPTIPFSLNSIVYVASGSNSAILYALNTSNGTKVWQSELPGLTTPPQNIAVVA